jgi:hypothetical protein
MDTPTDLQPPPWPEAPPGARIARGALRVGAARARGRWWCSSTRSTRWRGTRWSRCSGSSATGFKRPRRPSPGRSPSSGCATCATTRSRGRRDRARSASPFNIKESTRSRCGTSPPTRSASSTPSTPRHRPALRRRAVARAFELSQGQPWLVNALARGATRDVVPDAARAITAADIDAARELLIRRQDTHLDSLIERLHEERVRRVIAPMIAGRAAGEGAATTTGALWSTSGSCAATATGGLDIANPIYREVVTPAGRAVTVIRA